MTISTYSLREYANQTIQYPRDRGRVFLAVIGLLFLGGFALRVVKLDAPGLLPEREFRSALIARAYYFQNTDSVSPWRKQVAHASLQREGLLEPPILEYLVSSVYRLLDAEVLWVARITSISFWLLGGLLLYKIAWMLTSRLAAVVSLGYFLLAPLGVLASRSFQPDSLMIMMFLLSLYTILLHHDRPSRPRLALAALASGAAILIKPVCLFAIIGGYTALSLQRKGSWRAALDSSYVAFLGITLAPLVVYYGLGIFQLDSLRSQAEFSFRPNLLLHPEFWKGWLLVGTHAVSSLALLAGLLGFPLLSRGTPRYFVIGLWAGYFAFGLVFTLHIHTAGYYHLQLVPILSLSIGPLTAMLLTNIRQRVLTWHGWLPLMGALLVLLLLDIREVRRGMTAARFETEELAREIGEITSHSTDTVFLSPFYGKPLEYYAEISGAYWPRSITYWLYRMPNERQLSVEERIDQLGFSPEYFVVTHFEEFETHHADLKDFLSQNCPLLAESEGYLVYGACGGG